MATLSVIIPTFSVTSKLMEMALRLAKQVKPMCDELVITEDGDYCPELEAIATIYLRHPRVGHMQNMNVGVRASSGDFIGIIDSDISIVSGTLRDLCIPNSAVCGNWSEQREYKGFWGWCFVIDRKVLEDPEFAIPDEAGHEGLDGWGVHIGRDGPFIWTDKMEYSHLRGQSYSELRRVRDEAYRREMELHPPREVMPDRHLVRLAQDPTYREQWGNH